MTTTLLITAETPQTTANEKSERVSRCRVSPRHYRRTLAPFAPSGAAIAGALEIYLEGRRFADVPRMLFGLSVLRSGTAEQIEAALTASNAAIGTAIPALVKASVSPATILF